MYDHHARGAALPYGELPKSILGYKEVVTMPEADIEPPEAQTNEHAVRPATGNRGPRRYTRKIRRWFLAKANRRLLVLMATVAFASFLAYLWILYGRVEQVANLSREIREASHGSHDDTIIIPLILRHLRHEGWLDYVREACLHLSAALFIALIVIVTVELYSRKKLRREVRRQRKLIARDVWVALFQRFVPPSVVSEVMEIVKHDVVKDKSCYSLTLTTCEGLQEDRLVLRKDLTYSVRNIKGRPVDFPITSYIDSELTHQQGDILLPRHVHLFVNGAEVPLDKVLRDEPTSHIKVSLEHIIALEVGESALVSLRAEEVKPKEGTNSYIQLTPSVGLTIVVHNEQPDVELKQVRLQHPRWRALKEVGPGVYNFDGALLPGQGFFLRWAKRGKPTAS
ncbi:MAG TPA: hypothetical protein VHG32_11935 [Thermoanaerobaculia bacterium]|nr:hypothetical protein [Thermoanaerobaculia bacterium]